MTSIRIRIPADPGMKFARSAFDGSVGKQTALLGIGLGATAKITGAEVVDGGAAVLVTLECGEAIARHFDELSRSHFSFGFNALGQIETHATWVGPGEPDRG